MQQNLGDLADDYAAAEDRQISMRLMLAWTSPGPLSFCRTLGTSLLATHGKGILGTVSDRKAALAVRPSRSNSRLGASRLVVRPGTSLASHDCTMVGVAAPPRANHGPLESFQQYER